MSIAIVIVAAGSGTRLGAGRPKALVEVAGRSLLARSVATALGVPGVRQVVVVGPPEHLDTTREHAGHDPRVSVVPGGAHRSASVAAGLAPLADDVDVVLVHDAARALAPVALFAAVADAVRAGDVAVVPGLPVVDTVKRVDGEGFVVDTPDRAALRAVQTPQGFDRATLLAAHEGGGDATDDAALVEALGHRVRVVPGHPAAFKVTTPEDLERAERVLVAGPDGSGAQELTAAPAPRVALPRTGVGTDIHAFSDDPDRELWLGGLLWPGERGLAGHSDADVVAHAACNAVLSAAGLGDLGAHFGTGRPQWAGASGSTLLAESARIVRAAGFEIGNIAVQVVGNRPKVGPRRAEVEAAMSAAAGAPVSVSAATTDGLGFPGAGEGLVGIATALVVAR